MKSSRLILPSDTRMIYFGTKDVLEKHEEKEARRTKLIQAMQARNNPDQTPISIYLRLPNGETVETRSDVLNYDLDRDDIVIIKGGHFIPVYAILDVA